LRSGGRLDGLVEGAEFITQENMMSWSTSYFMKTLGNVVLARGGFKLTGSSLGEAALRSGFSKNSE
jgi:hypothetical protein